MAGTIRGNIKDVLKFSFGSNKTDLVVAFGVVTLVLMMVVPIPAFILDFLIIINLLVALLTILISLFVKDPVEFSIFPTMLLVTAVFGLALNISSTRLILGQGPNFKGYMIRAFGGFVTGGSGGLVGVVIGIVMFIIIIVVQVMVVTKGATRVSEVAARFALDSMQMKQMSIESEFNQGAITEEEMNAKKKALQRSMDFYGAMDGATKFISGNVKAGIFITLIDIVGGLIIGITLRGEPAGAAFNEYVSLTVGDGLVSQLPALLVSVSTGLLVTRSVGEDSFGEEARHQFSRYSRIYWIAGVLLFFMIFLPGFPKFILIVLSFLTLFTAFILTRRERAANREKENEDAKVELKKRTPEIAPVVPLDTLSMELGYGLLPMVDKEQGAELLERVTRIRREAALDLGLVSGPIRIVDNMRLDPYEYCLKIKGVEVGRGKLRLEQYMAINPGGVDREGMQGEMTVDPAFGLPAMWIADDMRDRAERLGYTVVDSPSVVATHLTEVIKSHAAELLGRQETQRMLDELRKEYPAVVDETMKSFSTGEVQKALQALLREQVSIRNIVTIMETLGDYGAVAKDTGFLVEKVRQALGRQITLQYVDDDKLLRVLTVEPHLEQTIIDSRQDTSSGPIAALSPESHRAWIDALANAVQIARGEGFFPVILCSESARPLIKNSCLRDIPDLAVLSILEISSDVRIESLGEIRVN